MYSICLECPVINNLKQTIQQKDKTIHQKNLTIKRYQHAVVMMLKNSQLDLFNSN